MATTINSYNVKLSMDARDYIDTSRLSRQETGQLIRTINESKSPADKFAKSIGLIEKAHEKGAIDARTYNTLLDRQKEKLHATNNAAMGVGQSIKGMIASYIGITAVMGGVKKSISLAIEVEQAETQFRVLTNSANNAKFLMGELRDFAAKSPVSLTGAVDSARTMLLFNVQIQDVMRNVKMLGDITGGNNERFKNLTLAFSQMTSAGRLLGQDLRQMVDAGFNPLQQISLKTGESMVELKTRMENGAVSAQEVTQAFVDATTEGGRFFGMSEEFAKTMGGKMTIAMSDLEQAAISLGQALEPLVIQITTGFSEGTGNLADLIWFVGKVADGWGLVFAAASDAFQVMKNIANLDFNAERVHAMHDFATLIEQRDREREQEKKNPATGLDLTDQALGHLPEAIEEVGDAAARANTQLDSHIEAYERHMQKLEDADNSRMQSALKNAQDYFNAQRKMDEDRMKQLAGTPIQSMEVGSSEAIKFLAGQHNQRLARLSRPRFEDPTQQQLVTEAQKQYAILLASERKQGEQLRVLEKILDEQRQNGFKRIR